jgi:hypothetical protein
MASEGQLKSPFNLCKILLIPKKGCATNISNWRPISLCSSSYKIFSAAIANRLKNACDKITDISQKGYSSTKNISEAVVNIFNNLKSQQAKGIDIATIALDFSKAFDKISHDFILKSLKFFGFGPVFINLIKTIISNRFAYIQNLDDSSLKFLISSGVPQGLAPSGYLFIIGLEILIIRIISETQLFTPIHNHNNENNTANNSNAPIITPDINVNIPQHETPTINIGEDLVNIAPGINENPLLHDTPGAAPFQEHPPESSDKSIYADDFTMSIIPTPENFYLFRSIMDEFFELSGLSTNYNKTTVMFSSQPSQECMDAVKNIGLKITATTCVLGFKFDAQLDDVESNIDDAISKMKEGVDFWDTFYLSLFGRINIWKSMIFSKLSYLLAVLSPNYFQTEQIDSMMFKFIAGKLRIAKDKLFLPINAGGLGLTDCRTYSNLLKINLYKRCLSSTDSWAKAIKYAGIDVKNGVYNINHEIFETFPYSKSILNAYSVAHNAFYSNEKSILSADFHDVNLFRSISNSLPSINFISTSETLLARRRHHLRDRGQRHPDLEGISMSIGAIVLRNPTRCCNKPYLANLLGCHLSNHEFLNVKNFINFIIKKFPDCGNFGYGPLYKSLLKKTSMSKIIVPIISACDPFKKLSTNKGTIARYTANDSRFAQDYLSQEKNLIALWKVAKFDNSFKSFCFEFAQNILYPNEQKAKFIPNYSPLCNICQSYGFLPAPKESIVHLFVSCPTIIMLRQQFINNLEINSQDQSIRELTLCGSSDPAPHKRTTFNLLNMIFNFFLYKNRNIPSIKFYFDTFLNEIESMLCILTENSLQKEDLKRVIEDFYTINV